MNLVEMLKPTEGEPCQWVGVYVTRWRREWGEPTAMFRDVDTADIANMPEVKALAKEAEWMFRVIGSALDRGIELSYLTHRGYEEARSALAPFKVPE